MEKTGTVYAINQRDKNYGLALSKDDWYNGFGKCPVVKGQEVKIEFHESNDFQNIDKVEVTGGLIPVEKLGPEKSNFPRSMKVAYAKDLIIAGKSTEEAIQLVKDLELAFQ